MTSILASQSNGVGGVEQRLILFKLPPHTHTHTPHGSTATRPGVIGTL